MDRLATRRFLDGFRAAVRALSARTPHDEARPADTVSGQRDPLTDACARRAFEIEVHGCHARLRDERVPFVLAMIDVDRLQAFNDTFGRFVGDRALQRTAHTLAAGVRPSDLVARLGGDEFAVLLPASDAQTMHRTFVALSAALADAMRGEHWPLTFSVGVIAFESAPTRAREACILTDRLMREVKAAGRDDVRFGIYRTGCLDLVTLSPGPGGAASRPLLTQAG